MRGKETIGRRKLYYERITPAYAGKSLHELGHYLLGEDHPRLCGEKFLAACGWGKHAGSPPPMRGKAAVGMYRREMWGITPAYAGKSHDFGKIN